MSDRADEASETKQERLRESMVKKKNEVDMSTLMNRMNMLLYLQKNFLKTLKLENEMTQKTSMHKSMPQIPKFNGDRYKWLDFKMNVKLYMEAYGYSDDAVISKWTVYAALVGRAKKYFDDFLRNEENFEKIMQTLAIYCGVTMDMIDRAKEKILKCKFSQTLYKEDVLRLKILVSDYFALCNELNMRHLNTYMLGQHLFNKLPFFYKRECRELCGENVGHLDLYNVNDYLKDMLSYLPNKPE